LLPLLIAVSLETHRELYHDWRQALAFCRMLPDVSPPAPVRFHFYWRERHGRLWRTVRPFGRKQALPIKAFLATQDRARCAATLWSDRDLSDNDWVQPLLPHITLKVYDAAAEACGTPLESHPRVYAQQDARAYRDGDLFRSLILYKYGGVYVDMDVVLLRSLGVFLDQEFVYQWDRFDDMYVSALTHVRAGSPFARELVEGLIVLRPGKYNWGRENIRRAFERGHRITVFPSPFFDTDWQAHSTFTPFANTPETADLYDGAFAWHWHNQWDAPIEPGCKFERLERRMEQRLVEQGLIAR
jgi:hypothetical protein